MTQPQTTVTSRDTTLPLLIEGRGVSKRYDRHTALDRIDFAIPEGVIFGLLGPNGAGKTSLIRILTGITLPDTGTLTYRGEPLSTQHHDRMGYLPEERGLYKKMKVGEQLMYLLQLKGLTSSEAEAKLRHWFIKLDIKDWWGKKVEELSKGMQQKVQFIATVAHDPDLIILDEPFSGFDPINADMLRDQILDLRAAGKTIILSTHRMETVESLCTHMVLIHKSRIVLEGNVERVRRQDRQNIFEVTYRGAEGALTDFPDTFSVLKRNTTPIGIQFVLLEAPEGLTLQDLLAYLSRQPVEIISVGELIPSMNEIFINAVREDPNSF